MTYNLTISVVLFNTDILEIENLLETLGGSKLKLKIFFIDNSPTAALSGAIPKKDNIEYTHTGKNLGFGAGHNVAINIAKDISEYHLVLNADVSFKVSILEEIYAYMRKHGEVGLIAPKIYNPDGSIQYSAKLLPSPANLILRRFLPIKAILDNMNNRYELRFFNFDRTIEVPYVMGCFMFINCKVFQKVKGFDESFFMYPEDIDLTRRIHEHYKTLYFPQVSIVHKHGRGSYHNRLLLYYHVTSMIKYFNKWGWLVDKKRNEINKKILTQFK